MVYKMQYCPNLPYHEGSSHSFCNTRASKVKKGLRYYATEKEVITPPPPPHPIIYLFNVQCPKKIRFTLKILIVCLSMLGYYTDKNRRRVFSA